MVYQILEDNNKNLWLSTNAGLKRYNLHTKEIKNFTIQDGLKTNQFNYKSSFKAENGIMYFGSVDGFVRFDPNNYYEQRKFNPSLALTELYVNNYPVEISPKKSPLKQSLEYTDKITLSHSQNTLTIKYAILSFSENKNDEIRYKLTGYDKDWKIPKNNQEIVYSNLTPGKYKLLFMNTIQKMFLQEFPKTWFTEWFQISFFSFELICLSKLLLASSPNYFNFVIQI